MQAGVTHHRCRQMSLIKDAGWCHSSGADSPCPQYTVCPSRRRCPHLAHCRGKQGKVGSKSQCKRCNGVQRRGTQLLHRPIQHPASTQNMQLSFLAHQISKFAV